MKKICLLLAALLYSGIVWGVQQNVGIISPLEGSVEVYIGQQKVNESTFVTRSDVVRTGKDSIAKLKMNNGDVFTIGNDTVISIEEYYDNDEISTDKPSVFQILTGKIRALVEREDKEKVMIKTGNAMVGVKGTDFIVEVPSNKVTQVTTISGIVSLRKMQTEESDKEILLGPGFRSILFQSQAPSNPIAISRRDHRQINRIFKIEDDKTLEPTRAPEKEIVYDILAREIERRIVQEALRKQAIITLDIDFK